MDVPGFINYHLEKKKSFLKRLQEKNQAKYMKAITESDVLLEIRQKYKGDLEVEFTPDKSNKVLYYKVREAKPSIELQNMTMSPIYRPRSKASSSVRPTRKTFTARLPRKNFNKKLRAEWQRRAALPNRSIIEEEEEEDEDQVVPQLHEPETSVSEEEQVVPMVASAGDRYPNENTPLKEDHDKQMEEKKKKKEAEEPQEDSQLIQMPEDSAPSVNERNEECNIIIFIVFTLIIFIILSIAIVGHVEWTLILLIVFFCIIIFVLLKYDGNVRNFPLVDSYQRTEFIV